jgi:hypothetical protein
MAGGRIKRTKAMKEVNKENADKHKRKVFFFSERSDLHVQEWFIVVHAGKCRNSRRYDCFIPVPPKSPRHYNLSSDTKFRIRKK